MTRTTRLLATLILALSPLLYPPRAFAQIEIEADPFAYALNGYSLHVAGVMGATRLSVGVFGLDVPQFLHGNDGWSMSGRGAGVKLDYLGSSPDGFFVGLDVGYLSTRYTLDAEAERDTRGVVGVGARAGYRIPVGRSGFYVAPWLSVSYSFDGDDVVIGAEQFDRRAVTLFPTVHVGWRF